MATPDSPSQPHPQHLASTSSNTPSSPDSQEEREPRLLDTMFGALNRFIARLDAGSEEQDPAHNAAGFQVLRNTNPDVPLEPWFDFVIGINGRTIDNPDPNLFATEVRNCAGSTISLGVFSAKGQKIREIYIPIPPSSPTLGLSLQWTPLSITDDVWHILDVIPNSPADIAGLLPYGDYVIGSPDGLIRGESGLGELVEDYLDRPLRLLVYNHEYNVTRPLTLTPTRSWGGEGALGCVLGFGALHRIPAPLEEPPQAPGETLFASEPAHTYALDGKTSHPPSKSGTPNPNLQQSFSPPPPISTQETNLFVPANVLSPTIASKSPPPPSAGKPRKARAHHAHHAPPVAAVGGLDDYFAEGEAKSREQDYVASKPKGGVAPPPKIGGPPRGGGKSPGPPPTGGEDKEGGGEQEAT